MTVLCFIDTESTGLDPAVHMPWEVCWWREDEDEPTTVVLPHTLDRADPVALDINRYHEREIEPDWCDPNRWFDVALLQRKLAGVTLVGSNPAFDAGMLAPLLKGTPWHHRKINVADGAMFLFGWDRPSGLDKIAAECRARGYVIPEPDHTAEGDVRATRAVYDALRAIRARLTPDELLAERRRLLDRYDMMSAARQSLSALTLELDRNARAIADALVGER